MTPLSFVGEESTNEEIEPFTIDEKEWQAVGHDGVWHEEYARLDMVDARAETHHGPVPHQLFPPVAQLQGGVLRSCAQPAVCR